MIIGIDGNEANVVGRVGVNTYAYETLTALSKLQDKSNLKHTLIVYLKNKPLPDMPEETTNFKYVVLPGDSFWIITRMTPYLITNKDRLDVFWSPSHYSPPIGSMPRVCSIMDLGYLDNTVQFTKKVFWQLKWWTAISIYVSKAVIAISNSTSKEIVRHYPGAKGKIYVTHLAYDKSKFNQRISVNDVRRVKNRYSIVDDYVLYIGTLKPSKNIEGLIDAFCEVSKAFLNIKLVIAGKKGWMYENIFLKVKNLGLEPKIIFTDFISEDEKPPLIAGAKVLAIPSFWEGFGLDVLNAMAAGVPVVASDAGSLPEVVGDAGILVDPYKPGSIAEGLKKVLSMNNKQYNSIVKKGLLQAEKFSWEKTALKTLEILENVKNV